VSRFSVLPAALAAAEIALGAEVLTAIDAVSKRLCTRWGEAVEDRMIVPLSSPLARTQRGTVS
jgi:hypothetical protein